MSNWADHIGKQDWLGKCEDQKSVSDEKRREAQENIGCEPLSDCCGANMEMEEVMICPKCKEHCGIDYE